MKFSNNNDGKRKHAEKLKTYIVQEQMQLDVPERQERFLGENHIR